MPNQQLKTRIDSLPKDVQSYIQFLEERNNAFLGMLDPDLHDYVLLLDLVGCSFLAYMNSLAFKEIKDSQERGEAICSFYEGLSKAIEHIKASSHLMDY